MNNLKGAISNSSENSHKDIHNIHISILVADVVDTGDKLINGVIDIGDSLSQGDIDIQNQG